MAAATKFRKRRRRPKKRISRIVRIDGCYEVVITERPADDQSWSWLDWQPETPNDARPETGTANPLDDILHDEFLPALVRAYKHNTDRLADTDGGTPASWASVVWHGNRLQRRSHAHQCTPLEFNFVYFEVSPDWCPSHWLDYPTTELEKNCDPWGQDETLDSVAAYVVKHNRDYFKRNRCAVTPDPRGYYKKSWHFAIAVEHDARIEAVEVSHFGRGLSFGTVNVSESRRFHIVTPDWPFAEKLNYKFTAKESARFKRHFAKEN